MLKNVILAASKSGQLHNGVKIFPSIIKNSNDIIKCAFLRGLADTDFTVTFKNRTNKGHNYPVIKASFKSKKLVSVLENLFQHLGFKYSTYYGEIRRDIRFSNPTITNSAYLYGVKNFKKWIKKVNFSNPKFQRKINKWTKDGTCPPGY